MLALNKPGRLSESKRILYSVFDTSAAGAKTHSASTRGNPRIPRLCVDLLESFEAALGGLDGRQRATFLLDQVILDAARVLRRGKDFLPRRDTFAEQHLVAFVG